MVEQQQSLIQRLWRRHTNWRDQTFKTQENHSNESVVSSNKRLAFITGLIALLLPITFIALSILDAKGFDILPKSACFHYSFSHFYYSPTLGSWFVGGLAIVAALLFSWTGASKCENHLATLAAFTILGVALVPTVGSGCIENDAHSLRAFIEVPANEKPKTPLEDTFDIPERLTHSETAKDSFILDYWANAVHKGSAIGTFLFLLFFSAVIFTRVEDEKHRDPANNGEITRVKKRRNFIYYSCSLIMLTVCCLYAVNYLVSDSEIGKKLEIFRTWDVWRGTLWVESIFLAAFGVAWMVKGRFWSLNWLDDKINKKQSSKE